MRYEIKKPEPEIVLYPSLTELRLLLNAVGKIMWNDLSLLDLYKTLQAARDEAR